jgi:biopolymer transport protein TolQ
MTMNNLLQIIQQLGLVAKIILLLLLFLSTISWAIIIEKIRLFSHINRESEKFRNFCKLKYEPDELYYKSRNFKYTPYAGLIKKFHTFFNGEHQNLPKTNGTSANDTYNGVMPGINTHNSSMVTILDATIGNEISRQEKNMVFLSTTVSISPFLGLLGTVWGIMNAFMSMGLKGSASISSVGPGIAEALTTTIAGLAVAIPALIAYNFFIAQIRMTNQELQTFAAELVTTFNREKVS